MSLKKITKAEIAEWGNASDLYKGFDVNVSEARGGGYEASIVVMWAPDGEHDGLVSIERVWGGSIEEVKAEVRDEINSQLYSAKQIAAMALKLNFTGSLEGLYKAAEKAGEVL
jgi:hypothetical protein